MTKSINLWKVVETKLTAHGPEITDVAETMFRFEADGIAARMYEQHENMFHDGEQMFSYAVKPRFGTSRIVSSLYPSHRMGGVE